MASLQALLRNRNIIFLLALAAGLALPFAVPVTRHLIIPALAFAMTLSTLEIGNGSFRHPRALLFPALLGITMTYIIAGNALIGLSLLIIHDEAIWIGFVLLAAVPPAIAVIPFTAIFRGNNNLALFGMMGAHLGGLAIMPLIAVGLLGAASFDPWKLTGTAAQLIVLPLILSRALLWRGWKPRIDPYRGTMTNWAFFVVLYTMIGLNRDILFDRIAILLPIVAILFTTTFILGFLIDGTGILLHIPKESRTSLVLLATLKNQGAAGGLAITFFSQEAALPAAVSTIVMIVYILWLDFKRRREPDV
jgi:BASS family bile acid:Na+ symporter